MVGGGSAEGEVRADVGEGSLNAPPEDRQRRRRTQRAVHPPREEGRRNLLLDECFRLGAPVPVPLLKTPVVLTGTGTSESAPRLLLPSCPSAQRAALFVFVGTFV